MATPAASDRSVVPFAKAPETLAERFWSIARGMDSDVDSTDPVLVVKHVLAVLDALAEGQRGEGVTANTLSFLHLLRQHEMSGDLLYASPEQARGEDVDERSLVFSVGVLLFEKLTGRHPFGVEGNPRRLARIRKGEMASGVNYFPKVPPALRQVLMTAMGPFPEERWRNLAELRGKLEEFVADAGAGDGGAVRRAKRPSLPGATGDDDETRVMQRPRRSSTDLAAAQVTSRLGTTLRQHTAPPIKVERGRRPRVTPVVWMIAGAAVASLAFVVLGHGSGAGAGAAAGRAAAALAARKTSPATKPAASPGPAASAPVVARAGGQAAAPAAASPAPAAANRPAPAAVVASRPSATPAGAATKSPATPALATFGPDAGGRAALAAALPCFGAARQSAGVQFGASLVYRPPSGKSGHVYYGAIHALQQDELRCLSKNLLGLTAGPAPARPTVITYSFWIDAHGGRVKGHIDQPKH